MMIPRVSHFCAAAALAAVTASSPPHPHIVLMLADDLGYNAPGYRNADLITPTLDSLAATGVKLEEFYTYKFCGPSRASLLTGRKPYRHDAVQNNLLPWSLPTGTNLSYTMIPTKLKAAGYATHHIGKWHQGFVTPSYTPQGRGFDTTFGFLVGGEDHYTQDTTLAPPWGVSCSVSGVDLWDNGAPAVGRTGRNKTDDERYNGYTFTQRAVDVINAHDPSVPFFMYFAIQNTHAPFEAPERFKAMYDFDQDLRNTFNGMVSLIDEAVANVTTALRDRGMWQDTVFIWTTDNGSPVDLGGSNEPLKGGKGSNWEGGCRVPFFATGGALPHVNRGKTLTGLAHIADLYATFAALAGLQPADPSGPAPVDGLDLWPWLSGEVAASPRTEIVYDHRMNVSNPAWGPTYGALRVGDWKLFVGIEDQASWYGHFTPNSTGEPDTSVTECSTATPCLYNLAEDPTEHINLAHSASSEAKVALDKLLRRFRELENEYHPLPNPDKDEDAYCAHVQATGGFVAPWREEDFAGAAQKSVV